MKHIFNNMKTKVEEMVNTVEERVKRISESIKYSFKHGDGFKFVIIGACAGIWSILIKKQYRANWMKAFNNRNRVYTEINGYLVDQKALTYKNCRKYQKLIDKGVRTKNALEDINIDFDYWW